MKELIQKLETAVLHRNPSLAQSLQPGLPVETIKKDLKRVGITGAIDPIIELYSWRNGTVLHGDSEAFKAGFKAGFAPPVISSPSESHKAELQRICAMAGTPFDPDVKIYTAFHYFQLKTAMSHMKSFGESARSVPKLSILVGRYFPILWDGSSAYLALDIDPSGHNRIVAIKKREDKPLREAYDSFDEFLKDLIWANENNEHLACVQSPKKHIEASLDHAEPSNDTIAINVETTKSKIKASNNILVLRTDFSNELAWKSICATIQDLGNEFGASFDFISDPTYDGLTAEQLPSVLTGHSRHCFAVIIDRNALISSDHAILVVDLRSKAGRTFRVVPLALADVENNLSSANMGFDEFINAVDQEGIFRGFRRT